MINKIPTIEEIYNTYHRETMFSMKGFYPRSIKNFDSVLNDKNIELLKSFQHFIEKNNNIINWKLYIIALSKYYKRRFDLKLLGSLAGTKIYRQYLDFINSPNNLSEEDIKNELISSLQFLKKYLQENQITLEQYFSIDINLIPVFLKHIYSGSVSQYFYVCLSPNKLYRIFYNIYDDLIFEFFKMNKIEFMEIIKCKRADILKYKNIRVIMEKIDKKFH